MKIDPKWLLTAAASAMTAALTPGLASAQTAPQEKLASANAPQLEEIVVTAQKRAEKINDVGMSITAATGELLLQRGITKVADLTNIEPSLQYSPSQNGTPIYTIRGVGYFEQSIAAAPAVSVYQDEVPYTYPVMTKGALLDVSRVEILKGPQGTLYGQNATGGAINFVANQPTDTFAAGVDDTWGRFNDNLLSGFVSGPVTPELNARLAASIEEGGAWQKSDTRNDSLGNKDIKVGRLLLDWQPADAFKASLNLNIWSDNSDTQANQLEGFRLLDPDYVLPPNAVPGGLSNPAYYLPIKPYSQYPAAIQALLANKPAPANDQAADWVPGWHPHNNEVFYQGTLRMDYRFSEALMVTSLSSYEKYTQRDQVDEAGVDVDSTGGTIYGDVQTLSQELRFHGLVADDKLEWLLGANYEWDKTAEDADFYDYFGSASYVTGGSPYSALPSFLGFPPFQGYSAFSYDAIHTASVFGNLEYHIFDNLDVHGGIRFTQSDQHLSGCANIPGPAFGPVLLGSLLGTLNGTGFQTVSPTQCDTFLPISHTGLPFALGLVQNTLDQNNVPWRVGVDWKVTPDDLLYATVSKGYKSGGTPTLGAESYIQFAPVTQESLLAYEVGFKTSFFERTMQLNGSLFHYDYTNKQMLGRISDPFGIFGAEQALVNIPKSIENGAELSLVWEPIAGLTLNAAATYLDSEVTSNFYNYASYNTGIPDTTNFKGEAFPFTPKWSLNYGAGYEWDIGHDLMAYVNANATYQSATVGSFGAQLANAQGPSVNIKAYGLLNLAAGVESDDGHWRGELWGKNVTDTYYWTNAFYVTDTTVRTAGMPATYGITVSYRY